MRKLEWYENLNDNLFIINFMMECGETLADAIKLAEAYVIDMKHIAELESEKK